MTHADKLIGKTVRITATSNEFAQSHVGKTGKVMGHAPLGMVTLNLDDGTADYWAETYNLAVVRDVDAQATRHAAVIRSVLA